MVYDLLRALPGDRALLPPSSAISRQLNASVGASGPHDFAVRKPAPSSEAPPASTASRLAFVTIASRPSVRRDGGFLKLILAKPKAEYFSPQGWTFILPNARLICPAGTIRSRAGASARHSASRRHRRRPGF